MKIFSVIFAILAICACNSSPFPFILIPMEELIELAQKLRSEHGEIIGVGRGGLIVAVRISHLLDPALWQEQSA